MTDGKAWRLGSALMCLALLTACAGGSGETPETGAPAADETSIVLSDSGVEVDGQAAPASPDAAVYVGADIVYYEDGRDETYGEGTGEDAHTAEEAAAHTVVTITQPGTYRVSGALSQGQLAVDLGGLHNRASVKIDFSTGEITINGTLQAQRLGEILGRP